MMRKIKAIFLLLTCVIAVSGCSVISQDSSEDSTVNTPEINPNVETANTDTSDVTLYFSYRGEDLLAGETRSIDVPVRDTLEAAVVRALIQGPSADSDELDGLFWEGVELVDTDTNSDILFVTLSNEFISTEPDDNSIVLEDASAQEQKVLAIYSIVDTIVEMGTYSRVQILVDRETGTGERITLAEAGYSDEDGYLGPLGRDQSLILTPENTLAEALESFEKKDWERLYYFTAYTSPDGTQKPDLDAFLETFSDLGNVLVDSDIVGFNVAFDGQSAVVMLDYSIKTREGETIEETNKPVVLIREDDIWKLSYTSLANLLINI